MRENQHNHMRSGLLAVVGIVCSLLLGAILMLGGGDAGAAPVASGSEPMAQAEAASSITLNQNQISLMVGQTTIIRITKVNGAAMTIRDASKVTYTLNNSHVSVAKLTDDTSGVYLRVSALTAGETKVKVTYDGASAECRVTVVEQTPQITSATLAQTSYTYTGNAIAASTIINGMTVKAGSTTLSSQYYDAVIVPDPIRNIGTYTVMITGKNGYSGSINKTFSIVNKSIADSNVTVHGFVNEKFIGSNGAGATQNVTLKRDGSVNLVKDVDYSIVYFNNSSPGIATMRIQGIGQYSGYREQTFAVYDANVATMDVTLSQTSYEFTGEHHNPSATVVAKAGTGADAPTKTLVAGTDYTITYENDINAGIATATIRGRGTYYGTHPKTFSIGKVTVPVPVPATLTYNGSQQTGVAIPAADTGKYTLSGDTRKTDAGSYAAIAILSSDNYAWSDGTYGSKTINWSIARCPVTYSIDWASFTHPTFTGSPITPDLPITTSPAGATYTKAFSNNTNAGDGNYELTATGNYEGTQTGTFPIDGAPVTIVADNITKDQYTDDPPLTATVTGEIAGTPVNYSLQRTAGENPGDYGISVVLGSNPNYAIQTTGATFTINPVFNPIVIDPIIDDSSIVYTGQPITPPVTFSQMAADFGPEDYDIEYTGNVSAGQANVIVTGKGDYAGKVSVGHFTIRKKQAYIAVEDATKQYGFSDPEFEATITGVIPGEKLNYELSRYDGEEIGTYPIHLWLGENPNYNVTVLRNGTLTILSPNSSYVPLYFRDVNGSTPHNDKIEWLAHNSISTGWDVGGGKREFRPGDEIIRADMAAFLFRMGKRAGVVTDYYKPSAAIKSKFADVDDSTPHAREIWWLAESGISTGWTLPDGTAVFQPYAKIVRQDMAAFLFRLAKAESLVYDNWTAAEYDKRHVFADVDDSTPHAREIWWAANVGISNGWPSGSRREFRGMNTVLRQDMAAFLYRFDLQNHIPSYD